MARRKKVRKSEEEYTNLALTIQGYQVRTTFAVNRTVYAPQYAWNFDEDEPLYQHSSTLTITAIAQKEY